MTEPLVTDWMSGGVEHEVRTVRLEGESRIDFHLRHAEAVRFWQTVFPPE